MNAHCRQSRVGPMSICFVLTLVFGLALLDVQPLHAQIEPGSMLSATSNKLTTTNYYFAKPNELTIIVNVMGDVQRPGRYEIATSIDLVNLISLAGGTTPEGSLSDVKVTRMLETDGRIVRTEFQVNLNDMSRVSTSAMTLSPGDIVEVNRSGWLAFRDTFNVIVAIALLTTSVVQIVTVTKH